MPLSFCSSTTFQNFSRIKEDQFTKALGRRIRDLRNERGWTLEGTENHGWVSWRHLQRLEAGKNFTVFTLVRVANLFGVHPSELLKDL